MLVHVTSTAKRRLEALCEILEGANESFEDMRTANESAQIAFQDLMAILKVLETNYVQH